ncbi:MAG: transporter substrate-binding domain-containing protein [Pseudomonadota bacterium]
MHKARFLFAFLFLVSAATPAAAETLLVGSTGDYAPLTVYDPATGEWLGRDVELIRAFAAETGREITFVQTTWPDLMADLQADRFALAIGGISWTKDRAEVAIASDTIETFGKVALARCSIAEAMGSLDAIDRAGIRIVSNRGGTNERFALANVRNAILTILPNNELPFEYLRAEVADVMFTDSIEADYLAQTDARLCVSAGPFTQDTKVALFRRDEPELAAAFDAWLAGRKSAD